MKRFNFLLTALILAVLIPTAVHAQTDRVVERIIEIGTTDNQTMEHLNVLSNRIGGRLSGSDAYANAVTWAAEQMRRWGMEVVLDEVGEVPVGFNRGPWSGRMLSQNGMTLHFATPSYTSGTRGVQRGHVVLEPKSRAQFDRMKGTLEGAWVLVTGMNGGWPIDYSERGDRNRERVLERRAEVAAENARISRANRANPDGEQQELLEMPDAPALFYREMVEAGILGIIQASRIPITALYDRGNIDDMDFFDNLPTTPDIKLNEHQYRVIEQKVRDRQLVILEFDIRNHFKPGPVKYHNVFGIIRGTEFPDEYVMMGGHLDAFDVATGGVDCGVGTTPAMESARLILEAGGRPKRSIVVTLWAAEEYGLLGSRHWVHSNMDKLPNISNYFNRDGGPLVPTGITVPEAMYEDFKAICEPINDINPDFPFEVRRRRGEPPTRPTRAGGSDHAWFAINGVPTLNFSLGDVKGYDFRYSDIWHTERDTYDMSIAEYQEHTAVVQAVVVYGLANLPHVLSRRGLYREPDL